jgi:NAD(P)-dependent dehydrogenase (short-subunit alcohol dehydrogenase family)
MNTLLLPFLLEGQVALVTGASSGLGRHFADVLAQAGAKVVLGARRLDRIEQARDEIVEAGGEAIAVALDVTDTASINAALDTAEQVFGTVTLVINNAGITVPKPLLNLDDADWRNVIDTNLNGVAYVTRDAARRMVAAGCGGSIVNIASILAERVQKMLSNYAAAKAGVVQFTKTAALELAEHNIRVNALCPGYVETEMSGGFFDTEEGRALVGRIPQKRLANLADLNGPLLLLASEAGAHMTGASITVDGGHVLADL